jgi:hypothetical protein
MDPVERLALDPGVARRIGDLALDPAAWIRRRVEQVSYIDQTATRRRVSIDFVVPGHGTPERPVPFAPLAQFAKQKLVDFDLHDSAGLPLPMLTTQENSRISEQVLRSFAGDVAGALDDPIVGRAIAALVRSSGGRGRDEAWSRLFDPRVSVGRSLAGNDEVRVLASELTRNFVLYVPVPSDASPGDRMMVKLAFEAHEERPARARGIRQRLGWAPIVDRFPAPLAGYGESYHFELTSPDGLRVADGALFGLREGEPVADDAHAEAGRAHFHLSGLDRGPARATVFLRPVSRALVGPALFAALLSTGSLWFVVIRLNDFAAAGSSDAVVAVLLSVPGLLTTYLVRPGEHAIVADLLAGVRALALAPAVASFTAALTLFAGFADEQVRWALGACAAASSLCAVLLGVSFHALRDRRTG